MYGSWDIKHDRQFFVILDGFLPFNPDNNPKNQNFEKMKKNPGDIIILNKCTINEWFLRHGEWQTEFFFILDHFLPFTPHNNLKNQNFEKMKITHGDIIILDKCTKNHDHMLYCSLDMAHNRFNCYFSFWAIFYLFTSLTAQKIQI